MDAFSPRIYGGVELETGELVSGVELETGEVVSGVELETGELCSYQSPPPPPVRG